MSLALLGILNSQAAGGGGGAFELISTQLITGATASVSFASIPQDYKHLQIRTITRSTTNAQTEYVQFNNDTGGTKYTTNWVMGDGNSPSSNSDGLQPRIRTITAINGDSAGIYGVSIKEILDYSSSVKNTTLKHFWATNSDNNSRRVALGSGMYNDLTPISSIKIGILNAAFAPGSRLSLYGIRG